jgi:hypothetical protein
MKQAIGCACALLAAGFWALPAPAQARAAVPCNGGAGTLVGDLGFRTSRAAGAAVQVEWGRVPVWTFGGEPVLGGITAPGAGKLREGDVLVSVDGHLITTGDGALRYANARPGDRVRLGIRRGGRVEDVVVTAGERCLPLRPRPPAPRPPPPPPRISAPGRPPAPQATPRSAPPAPPAPPAPAPARTPPAPPPPPLPPGVLPDGWFGFGIHCRECGIRQVEGEMVFFFSEPPEVVSVEPGTPAAQAGMRRGDRLTHVDGVALTTAAGWRAFGGVRAGQQVRWTYTRGGQQMHASVRAVRRPDSQPLVARSERSAAAREEAHRLRYSGTVGDARVEVRGAPVTVTTDESTGETVVRSRDLVVRIRPERP